jgi:protein phosphatase slingshot
MWGYIEHVTTSSRIIYDKTTDLISHYASSNIEEEKEITYNNDDELKDKNNDNPRIYPIASYGESYKGFTGDPTLIIDNIYLGSAYNAASYNTLKKFDIKVIINATAEISNYFPYAFKYYRYSLYDNNKHTINQYLDDSFNVIKHHQDNTPGNILIHCFMGASRSVSIVIHYLMKTMTNKDGSNYTFDEALQYIKNKRSIINPTNKLADDIKIHNKV